MHGEKTLVSMCQVRRTPTAIFEQMSGVNLNPPPLACIKIICPLCGRGLPESCPEAR